MVLSYFYRVSSLFCYFSSLYNTLKLFMSVFYILHFHIFRLSLFSPSQSFTHCLFITAVLLRGLYVVTPSFQMLIVFLRRHVSVFNENVWQMGLYGKKGRITLSVQHKKLSVWRHNSELWQQKMSYITTRHEGLPWWQYFLKTAAVFGTDCVGS